MAKNAPAKREAPPPATALAPLEPRIAYHPAIAAEFGLSQSSWLALVDAVFPLAKSASGVALALSYCRARKLDPFKKVCHIVPMYSSALRREVETVWPGIAELRTTAFRTGFYAGCDPTEFGPVKTFTFDGEEKRDDGQGGEVKKKVKVSVTAPEWCRITVYRMVAGQRVAFPGPTIYFLAAYGKKSRWSNLPTEKWERTPSYMLEKVAEAAALRKAFPEELGDWSSADEVEAGIDLGGPIVENVLEPERQAEPERQDRQERDQSGGDRPKGIDLVDGDGVVVANHPGMTAWATDLEARLNALDGTAAGALYAANRATLETISTRAASSGAAELAETCKRIAFAFAYQAAGVGDDEPAGAPPEGAGDMPADRRLV